MASSVIARPKICHRPTLFFQVKLTAYINFEIHSLNATAESLAMQYDTDISSAFPSQLLSFRSCFHSQLLTRSTILEVAQLLLIDYHACTFFHLQWFLYGLHALADVASDRCNLWAIWNWSKTSFEVMSQERHSYLTVFSIENHRAKPLDTSGIVDAFAQEKARKWKFDVDVGV